MDNQEFEPKTANRSHSGFGECCCPCESRYLDGLIHPHPDRAKPSNAVAPGRQDAGAKLLDAATEPPEAAPERRDALAEMAEAPAEKLDMIIDRQKGTILVVSHEASRSGAPILALNIIQRLSARYNVISLLLGGGELTENFHNASALLYVADRTSMSDEQIGGIIRDMSTRYPLIFAIANTVESRPALGALKERGVPIVLLVHEFAAYIRPRSVFQDTMDLSTETVFSTRITLENAIEEVSLYSGRSIHIIPQGRCDIPAAVRTESSEEQIYKLWSERRYLPPWMRKFLVIGIGTVEFRKGVDFFISCASIIKNQKGGERIQFLWIGRGFDPETDANYSVYLSDQIKRAGVDLYVRIIPSTSKIELAYQTADLLLLPSRLDPLPGVAIEAFTFGLPVVCFERTTGIADFLTENGLGDECVARYLDTHDLAKKVKALADSDGLRARVSRRARAAAEERFDMNAYVSKIEAIAVHALGKEAHINEEVETILASGKFRSDFFTNSTDDSVPEEKIIELYVRRMASGVGIRKPMPGFQPTVYDSIQRAEGRTSGDPFADFLRKGLPEGPWRQKVIQVSGQEKAALSQDLRVALHVHVFYPDELIGIVRRLNLNASTPDLFISVVTLEAAAEAREVLSIYRGKLVDLKITPNLGRDLGPLLTQFGRVLCAGYEIVGHLHTKKSAHVADRSVAEAWIMFLLDNLIGGERGGAMLDSILSMMALDSGIGIVFPDDPHVIGWTKNRKYAEDLAARMKLGALPEQFNFPVGSMFWVRSKVLAKLVELDLAWNDYAPEPLPIDGTIQHAIERLFGVLPTTIGMSCAVTNVRGLTR